MILIAIEFAALLYILLGKGKHKMGRFDEKWEDEVNKYERSQEKKLPLTAIERHWLEQSPLNLSYEDIEFLKSMHICI